MFTVLRDTETGICRREDDQFPTCGSQVSVLAKVKKIKLCMKERCTYMQPRK